jgi:hypothetical protein
MAVPMGMPSAQDRLRGITIKYNEGTGKYFWTNPDNVNIYLSDAEALKLDPNVYQTGQGKKASTQWANTYEPQWNKYGEQMQRQLQTAFDRSYADAQGKLGYGLSMSGSGEGGLAEASRLALTQEAQNKRMDIAATRDQMLQQAYIQFMTTKDQQAFDMAKMAAGYEYQRKMAEMNQPTWWDSLGSIVGMGMGMLLAAPTGGLSMGAGAIIGGGVGSSMTNWMNR